MRNRAKTRSCDIVRVADLTCNSTTHCSTARCLLAPSSSSAVPRYHSVQKPEHIRIALLLMAPVISLLLHALPSDTELVPHVERIQASHERSNGYWNARCRTITSARCAVQTRNSTYITITSAHKRCLRTDDHIFISFLQILQSTKPSILCQTKTPFPNSLPPKHTQHNTQHNTTHMHTPISLIYCRALHFTKPHHHHHLQHKSFIQVPGKRKKAQQNKKTR